MDAVGLADVSLPPINFDPTLPISSHSEEIVQLIRDNQVVIVAGETGSGKTTQLPKMCLLAGRKHIAHTQPRRIAARSVAERIASELRVELGDLVGYQVRFTKQAGRQTRIKLMTDGILLAEITGDRELRRYDTIIIDEAHERSLNIDFLLGYVKQLCTKRRELRVIITSATIDTQRFSTHFDNAPIIQVSGRGFPVEVRYRPLDQDDEQADGIVAAARELMTEGPGDILVFCSGEREIQDGIAALEAQKFSNVEVLALHSRLSATQQHQIFQAHQARHIILATNIAETSLTVPGIRYVIDAGTARISRYSTRTKVQRLPIEPISQASANQRSGRCGRIGPGVAIRLYSEEDFLSRDEFTEPEILRTNLASVILQMAKAKLGDIKKFPFIEAPDSSQIGDGMRLLTELGAIKGGDGQRLTRVGHAIAELPVDPRLGRMIIEANRRHCLREVLVIVSFLGIQDIRERPFDHRQQADQLHARFFSDESLVAVHKPLSDRHDRSGKYQSAPARYTPHTLRSQRFNANNARNTKPSAGGDLDAVLRLWGYLRAKRRELTGNQFRKMCRAEFLNYLRIRQWQDLHSQLRGICKRLGMKRNLEPADLDDVLISLLSGLLSNIGMQLPAPEKPKKGKRAPRSSRQEFLGARGIKFAIQPGGALAKKPPELVMAVELVETSRLWARMVAGIKPEWVEQVGKHLLRRNYGQPHFSVSRANVVAREKVTLLGVPIIVDRLVNYGKINPAQAREIFIQTGLVEGEWLPDETHANHDFLNHNRQVIQQAESVADRARTGSIIDDHDIFEFYDVRLPSEIHSGSTFDKWWRNHSDKGFLEFDLDYFADSDEIEKTRKQFPDRWKIAGLNLPVQYVFEPGAGRDGVSIRVPMAQLNQIKAQEFSWQVPGLRLETATELIRGLPKNVRTNFIPAADYARRALAWLETHHSDHSKRFCDELGRALAAISGVQPEPDDWRPDELPTHLKVGFEVTKPHKSAEYSRDLAALRQELSQQISETITAKAPSSKSTTWTFSAIPECEKLRHSGMTVLGYPALRDLGDGVSLVYEENPSRQAQTHRGGVRRLIALNVPDPTRWAVAHMSNDEKLALPNGPYPNIPALLADCRLKAIEQAANKFGGLTARSEKEFERLALAVRQEQAVQMSHVVSVTARVCALAAEIKRLASSSPIGDEIIEQLNDLVFEGFIAFIRDPWFEQVPKYCQAMIERLTKYPANPARDNQQMESIYQLLDDYESLCEQLPSGRLPDEVDDIAFMIEELRVQFFAQHLGTRLTVSPKRIRKAIGAARPEP